MFTGIIEEIGEIAGVKRGQVSSRLAIRGKKIFSDLKLGDSVAVNGVCLTATSISGDIFEADVMAETLRRTNLGGFSNGTRVNLERAMAAGGRFGGHIVSGHIDGTGRVSSLVREENAVWVRIDAEDKILRYIIEKGPSPSMGSVLRWRKQAPVILRSQLSLIQGKRRHFCGGVREISSIWKTTSSESMWSVC